ncbi:hypothetical protein [Pseudoalteromonas undina]|uniref:hypothetical protein n=1 Tax=Pseudoalteromonas undina TaxID=43660 RepID=UPI000ACDD1B0|nr:hypothetical protein [Pseudoalteromonas undina]
MINKEIPCHIEHFKDKMMPRSIHDKNPNFIKYNDINRLFPIPDFSHLNIDQTLDTKFEYISEYLKIIIVGTLLDEFPHWDPKTKNFLLTKVVSYSSNKIQAGKNSFYSSSELVKLFKLQVPDDFYSDLSIDCQSLTLPPNTNLESHGQNLIIDNPYLTLEIDFDFDNHIQSGCLDYDYNSRPISNGWSGEPVDFKNYFLNILYKVQYKKFRYGDINRDSYIRWIASLEAFLSEKFSP